MMKLIFNFLLYFFVREGAPLVVSQYEIYTCSLI